MEEVVKQEQVAVQEQQPKAERHYGLDLLRILSMLMVLFCHLSNYSYGLGLIAENSPSYYIRQVLIAFCIVMINCFVLTSAYFLVKQKFRLSRLFKLELTVIFWLAVCCIINAINKVPDFWENEFLIPFFPVTLRVMWFYSAYMGMCLLSPLFNLAIRHMNKGIHLTTCIVLVLMATIFNNAMANTNAFTFYDGYNLAWFVVLYFVGGYIRLYVDPSKIKVWPLILIYVLMSASIVGDWFLLKWLRATYTWFEPRFYENTPYNYNSIFTFISSVAFFIIFLKVKIRTKLKFCAPHVFAVYILDRGYVRTTQYEYAYIIANIPISLLQIFVAIILIFSFRILLDYLRSLLFKLFENRKWYKSFLRWLDQLPYRIVDRFNKGEQAA